MVPIEVKPILSWAKVRVSTVLRSRIFLPAHAQIKKYRRLSTMFNKKTPYPLLHTAKYLKVIEEQVGHNFEWLEFKSEFPITDYFHTNRSLPVFVYLILNFSFSCWFSLSININLLTP